MRLHIRCIRLFVRSEITIRSGRASNHCSVSLIPTANGISQTNEGTSRLIFELSKMTLQALSPSSAPSR